MSPALIRILRCSLFISVFACSTAAAPTGGVMAGVSDAGPDATLSLILHDIDQGKLDVAMARTRELLAIHPNFRLANLIYGDLLLAQTQPLTHFGDAPHAPADRLEDLRQEAVARLKGYTNRPTQAFIPRYLLQMPTDERYAIVVDTQRSRLYIYRNESGRPVFVADYYVSQGKAGADKTREGDRKTPVGVYHVTSSLPKSKLPDFYGSGAYPISYPNEWDRMNGRAGHGIWLHGVPSNTYARPPLTSDGCVVLANQDLSAVASYLQIGLTPVIISDSVEWLSLDDWRNERAALDKEIEAWRSDWESRDADRYLQHYSPRFRSNDGDLKAWSQQKRDVARSKTWVKVNLREMSMLRNPGKQDVVVVSFEQDYHSNNLNNVVNKRQYWVKESGQWKIIYEGVS